MKKTKAVQVLSSPLELNNPINPNYESYAQRKERKALEKKARQGSILVKEPVEKLPSLGIKKKYDPFMHYPPRDTLSQNALADEMVVWSKRDDSINIAAFPISKNINPYRFYKLAEQNDYFKEALQLAKYTIGSRLNKEWHDEKIGSDYAKSFIGIYDPEYKQEYTSKVSLMAAKNHNDNNPITVQIEAFPASPLVPEKKE